MEDLHPYQVAGRILGFRKPKSMVQGDLFPKLVTKAADFLAIPLCDIYNEIKNIQLVGLPVLLGGLRKEGGV